MVVSADRSPCTAASAASPKLLEAQCPACLTLEAVPPRSKIRSRIFSAARLVRLPSFFRAARVRFIIHLSPPNTVVLQRKFVVLPKRIPNPIFAEQDSVQVGMPSEPDAAQVVGFAL